MSKPFRVGWIGSRYGGGTAQVFQEQDDFEIIACCDINPERRQAAGEALAVEQRFADYEELLDSGVNVVFIGTPQNLHAPMAVAALKRGLHVLSEVPAAVDFEQCCRLADAARESPATYMLAENYTHVDVVILVGAMARAGLFGEIYFGEGEYVHELKELNEKTPWRRVWQTGRNGNTYPTHSLGPLLQWSGQRVVSVSCLGSGHHYRDPRGDLYENEDTTLMLCKTDKGSLFKIRLDMLSERPHNMNYHTLQGTEGCYEGPRGFGDDHKVWLRGRNPDPQTWAPLWDYRDDFLPAERKRPPESALRAGHGGGDYWMTLDFVRALREGKPPAQDVMFALDVTVPGLVSQQSIALGGAPMGVPDFRRYEPGSLVVPPAATAID